MITSFRACSAATPVLYSVLIYCTPALPLRSCRQQKQGEEFIVSHLLLVPSRVMRRWIFAYIYMCCVCDWFTQIVVEKSFLFSKIHLDGRLWSALILSVFLLHFTFLILEFLKKSVIQELRTRKNGLIKRFSRVGPIITHSRESSNSQRDPQDHAHS